MIKNNIGTEVATKIIKREDQERYSVVINDWMDAEVKRGNLIWRDVNEIEKAISTGNMVGVFSSGVLVGVCAAYEWEATEPEESNVIEIGTLIVDGVFQGNGYSSSLVEAATDAARENFPNIPILTYAKDDRAIRAFCGHGYELIDDLATLDFVIPKTAWESCKGECPCGVGVASEDCKFKLLVLQAS